MDKEEPNLNIWGEISDSELVLEAVKVEQKVRKRTRKTALRAVIFRETSQETKNKSYCKK